MPNHEPLSFVPQDYLRRAAKWILPAPVTAHILPDALLNLLANLEHYGYTLSAELLAAFEGLEAADFNAQSALLLENVKALRGAEVEHQPFYPNFPQQVKAMTKKDLQRFAFIHYLGDAVGVRLVPKFEQLPRPPLAELKPLTLITLGSREDYDALMRGLLHRPSALSENDAAALREWLLHSFDLSREIPTIPHRETKALWLWALVQGVPHLVASHALRAGYTMTDVLRLAVALSGGDVSLATSTRFKIQRAQRRILLQLMENIAHEPSALEDLARHGERWKRLLERLHPFEFKKYTALHTLLDRFYTVKNPSLAARFEALWGAGDYVQAIDVVSEKAGELARRLDFMLRTAPDDGVREFVAKRFEAVAKQLPTPLLLQLLAHFENRVETEDYRLFFPKGQVSKLWVTADNRAPLPKALCAEWVERVVAVLDKRFAMLSPLGKVYIDPDLVHYPIPFQQRSASKSLHTLARGSQSALAYSPFWRFFVYWHEGRERVDIDLSLVFFDYDFNHLGQIAYYDLQNDFAVHSGDVTSAPQGASEFVDLDTPSALAAGVRYVVMMVQSFSGQAYKDLPQCFAGVMARDDANAGAIFEPKTVTEKWDLANDGQINMPLLMDLVGQRWVWLDLGLKRQLDTENNVHGHLSSLALVARHMLHFAPPNLYQLFTLHANARGEIVQDKAQADWVFSAQMSDNSDARWVLPTQWDEIFKWL